MANKLDMADSAALVDHFSSLYEHSPLHVVLYDPQDMVRYANPAHCTDFGMARDVQMSWSDMMRHSYQNQVGAAINTDNLEAWLVSAKARRGKLPFRTFETDLRNGRWMYITETMDDQGWMLSVGFDITALRANDRSLRQARDGALRAAQVDTLTGVSSRAHVLEQLDLRLNQLRSTQQPCGLVLVDLAAVVVQILVRLNHLTMDWVIRQAHHHPKEIMAVEDHMDSPMADHPHLLGAVVAVQTQLLELDQTEQ
ncbi:MAG: hypothetical protein EBR58_09725, partial [Betaproteobacteria bacterium]|nr:hypothetical protein [Betaproteobacteria bacterium]